METSLTTLLLKKCAQTVEEVLIPNLTAPFAAEQAANIVNVLRLLAPAVEEKSQELGEENERMKEVLGRVVEVLQGEKTLSRNTVRNRLLERFGHNLKKVGDEPPDVIKENHNLKEALVETIKGLDALTEDLSIETISSLRQQIRSVLRQQLDHGMARIAGLLEQFSYSFEQASTD
ncbi:MAG: hypothetical protein V3S51_00365 [Dehalococcoidia bacterium]